MRPFRRRPTHADGSWIVGRGWYRIGFATSYFLNTSNLPGMRFYHVQVWLGLFDIALSFNGMERDPDVYFETFDKHTGRIGDARIDNPQLAARMDKYRHEGRWEWRVMGRFPWKFQSLEVKQTWTLNT
jgi:hypothetical protein